MVDIPKSGWFESNDPSGDYQFLENIAHRSSSIFADSDKIDVWDLKDLEDDFNTGKVSKKDYYFGFIDGEGRGQQTRNAIHDMNSYLTALREFQKKGNDLRRVLAVRFFQEGYQITRIRFVPKPDLASAIA